MKLKKWGVILLALCMMFMAFPITAMANDYNTSGPLGEKKVIENNLIVQLPPSVDEMIGTSPSEWLAVASEPTWGDGTILDFVNADQKFYDSTGKEMTDDDKFQNNSQYMVKTTFQSFEYYYGDYYYVLSGKNKVYVDINRQRYPMTVTVGTDANGNPVISATYSFSIGTPTEEPEVPEGANSDWAFTCEAVKLDGHYRKTGSLWMSIQNKGDSPSDIKGMKLYVYDFNDDNNDLSEDGWDISDCVGTEENGHTIAPGETCEWNWLFDDDTRNESEGAAIPYKVVIRDANGNELFAQQVEMTYAPVDSTYECVVTKVGDYNATPLDNVDVVMGQTTDYMIRLIRTAPDGTKEYVNPKSMMLDWNTVRDLSEYMDLKFKAYDDYYTLSITGKKKPTFSSSTGVEFYFCYPSYKISDCFFEDEGVKFNYVEPHKTHVRDNGKVTAKATTKSDGKIAYSCSICKRTMETKPIYKISSVKLSNTAYTYNGKAKKPTVTVKDRTGKVISSKNYTVAYEKGRVNVGTYKVTVKLKGNYAGTVTKSFKINPKATGIVSATGKSKAAVVKWKKSTKQVTGYQIRYASKSNMANAKSVLVSKNTIVSKKISKLKAKKTYYIQVRTYKTVKGTKYYSAWSKVKEVKTKK